MNSADEIQCATAIACRVASAVETCSRYPLSTIGTIAAIDQIPLFRLRAMPLVNPGQM
jgi:hypothetical protein